MTKAILIGATLLLAAVAHPQGLVIFANRGGAGTEAPPGQVRSPIYREDPADPTHRISGNTPAGIIPGTTSYNGAAFVAAGQGPTFTATLWGRLSTDVTGDAVSNNLVLLENGTVTFHTQTSGIFAGIINQPLSSVPVPGVVPFEERATFQMRVWDTRNGAIMTWDEVWLSQNNDVLRGYSEIFTVPFDLGDPNSLTIPPYLQGLESFNVFIVPEPSVLMLSILGLCGFLYFRRQR